MAKSVFTGWRTVTPGACLSCGYDDGWQCDGRGTITCDCQAEDEEQDDDRDPIGGEDEP